jgi:hypothetical protein
MRLAACPLPPAPCSLQVFDIQKHWWALKLVEQGHKVLYMDAGA